MSQEFIPYSQAAHLDPRIDLPRPSIDSTLAHILDAFPIPEKLDLNLMRGVLADDEDNPFVYNADTIMKVYPNLRHTPYSILGPVRNSVVLSIFTPNKPSSAKLPVFYHIHGGGMVSGDRFSGLAESIGFLGSIECVIISVEYRLAPETPAPGAAEDCYAGLHWLTQNAITLGIDPAQVIIYGVSGGGALAAIICLMARDRKRPIVPVKGLMLHTPMLDDRCQSLSDQQFEFGSPWCGVTNRMAWDRVLGELRGTDHVTGYHAPSRATDLSNLPPTYIDAAECEVFRDPAMLWAMDMWRCGSTCELHIWPGGWHIFDMMDGANAPLVQTAVATKRSWLERMMKI